MSPKIESAEGTERASGAERSPQKITTCLWFDNQAEEAARYYTSLFDDSRVVRIDRYGEAGPGTPGEVMLVTFELRGQRFLGLNGGPEFTFSEAISLHVDCETQQEVDRLWAELTTGGEESQCGWLKDRYGLSWQLVPRRLHELLADPDAARTQRVMTAMLGMGKLDIRQLEEA